MRAEFPDGRVALAVGDRIEVHFDGGNRSGQDVLKALCLGARGTYIGRPFLYGLGALGKPGVTLALCGKRDIR
jgi:L-lactate dehydrogenase (cytochrome)